MSKIVEMAFAMAAEYEKALEQAREELSKASADKLALLAKMFTRLG